MATGEEKRPRRGRPETYREIDKLLGMAEKLESRCESQERWLAIRLMLYLFAIGMFGYFFVATPWNDYAEPTRTFFFAAAAVITLALLLIGGMSLNNSRKHLRRDRRAVREIISMLREIEPAMADTMNLNALARAEFRIRLSRFDIDDRGLPFPFDIVNKFIR